MKVVVGVDCTKFTAWFTYTCPECGHGLDSIDGGLLRHPEHDWKWFNKVPFTCINSGKVVKEPVIELECEEVSKSTRDSGGKM